ncbi:unnamed protein product [Pleuronectes platessa]|uniref:Uncharacterized protein n=1 Tax=Pleuronectes platessa TaxID=8262 RepID=A0A9N7VS80_PLEPL|nr:unnamed protein product [Pleuronectes platessa]
MSSRALLRHKRLFVQLSAAPAGRDAEPAGAGEQERAPNGDQHWPQQWDPLKAGVGLVALSAHSSEGDIDQPEPVRLRTAAGHFGPFPHPGTCLPGEGVEQVPPSESGDQLSH